jgi:predicted DsbA family dithiol-disulfide isomerase
MGGLLADWRSYDDPLNDIHSPAQMGPQWFQVRELSGMPLDERIWQVDPPDSSYPACLAVKAAELQGQEVAEHYLRRLREAALLERRNIARQEELYALAQEVAQRLPAGTLDVERLRADLAVPALLEAFRHDLREAAYTGIGRFPTLILHHRAGHSLILVGYRPYDALLAALEHLAPALPPGPAMVPQELARDYIQRWERVTAREVAEILERTTEQTTTLLESLVAEGNLAHAQETQSSVPLYIPVCR